MMSGLPRFDFYPRDWISGTRGLSDRARGVYVDLLARMYDLGRPLDFDIRDLCRFLGYRDRRQLDPVLRELITAGKIAVVDGKLTNARALREIAAAHERIAAGKRGGRPRKKPAGNDRAGNEIASRSPPDADLDPILTRSQGVGTEQNQPLTCNTPSSILHRHIPFTNVKGAEAPQTLEKQVYDLGKRLTGSGGQVTRLRDHHHGDLTATLGTLRLAETKADPASYIGAILRGHAAARAESVLDETDRLYRALGVG